MNLASNTASLPCTRPSSVVQSSEFLKPMRIRSGCYYGEEHHFCLNCSCRDPQLGVSVMSKSKWKHRNAQKHAVFSRFLIIGGEDPRQFQKLVDEIAEDWQPEGTSEHDAVFEIAKGIWLKRRFQLFLMVEATRNAGNPDHPSYDERIGLAAFLARTKMSPEDGFSHGSHFLRKELLESLMKECPKTNFKSEAEWFAAVQKAINSMLPVFDAVYSNSETYYALMNPAATFSGDLFERAIAVDERLNAMIDRATKRLIQVKAMKQVLGHAPKKPEGELIKLPREKAQPGKIRHFSPAPARLQLGGTSNG
jgi:hypothetical protein